MLNIVPNNKEKLFARCVFDLIDISPNSFFVVKNQKKLFNDNGFIELNESKPWNIEYGKNYFVTRNNSSLIAFKIPNNKFSSLLITASHGDYPLLCVKRNPQKDTLKIYSKLGSEVYGASILDSWFDVPLGLSGRVCIKKDNRILTKLLNIDKPLLMLPRLAYHLNRKCNSEISINVNNDLNPVLGSYDNASFLKIISEQLNVNKDDILDYELFFYRQEKSKFWGANEEYVSSRAIDDQVCAYSSLFALLDTNDASQVSMHVMLDNEELGSSTKQGAESTFLSDVIDRLFDSFDIELQKKANILSNSIMLSADNAHALHPNSPEYSDRENTCIMGTGPVIKYSGKFSYATDSVSSSIVKMIAKQNSIPLQEFFYRPDLTPGSTLSKHFLPTISIKCADIGLAQLAMHSTYETCSVKDVYTLKNLLKCFYKSDIVTLYDGEYCINSCKIS